MTSVKAIKNNRYLHPKLGLTLIATLALAPVASGVTGSSREGIQPTEGADTWQVVVERVTGEDGGGYLWLGLRNRGNAARVICDHIDVSFSMRSGDGMEGFRADGMSGWCEQSSEAVRIGPGSSWSRPFKLPPLAALDNLQVAVAAWELQSEFPFSRHRRLLMTRGVLDK